MGLLRILRRLFGTRAPGSLLEDQAKRLADSIARMPKAHVVPETVVIEEPDGELADPSLEEYRQLLGDCPPPTDEQILDFVDFVSKAHSWYKHLPLVPPGQAFSFYFDPLVACDRVSTPEGKITWVKRVEGSPYRFHYTWMPTDVYRKRFGLLAYTSDAGMVIQVRGAYGTVDPDDRRESLCAGDGRRFRVPIELLQATSVPLTGVIHPRAACAWVWEQFLGIGRFATEGQDPPPVAAWPEETGGQATLESIRRWCVEKRRDAANLPSRWDDEPNAELSEILGPERTRVKAGMAEAIRRARALAYP